MFFTYNGKKTYLKVSLSTTLNVYVFDRAENRESATIFYKESELFDAYQDGKKRLPNNAVGFELLHPHKTPPDPKTKLHPVTPKPLDVS